MTVDGAGELDPSWGVRLTASDVLLWQVAQKLSGTPLLFHHFQFLQFLSLIPGLSRKAFYIVQLAYFTSIQFLSVYLYFCPFMDVSSIPPPLLFTQALGFIPFSISDVLIWMDFFFHHFPFLHFFVIPYCFISPRIVVFTLTCLFHLFPPSSHSFITLFSVLLFFLFPVASLAFIWFFYFIISSGSFFMPRLSLLLICFVSLITPPPYISSLITPPHIFRLSLLLICFVSLLLLIRFVSLLLFICFV